VTTPDDDVPPSLRDTGCSPVSRRHRWTLVALAAALSVPTAGATACAPDGNSEDLPYISPLTRFTLYDAPPGKTDFSIGDVDIDEPGKAVQVVSVKALYSTNVEYLGAYVVWPRDYRLGPLSFGSGYPDSDQRVRHDLDEVVPASETSYLAPGESSLDPVALTLGFRIRSGNLGGVNGIHVVYRADGKSRERYFSIAAIGCVEPRSCESSDNRDPDFFEKAMRELGLVRD